MKPMNRERVQIAASLVALFLPSCAGAAQTAQTVSLAEQLRAQYKLAKTDPQGNSAKILQPGTVLVIQKGGILTVPFASTAVCSARYQGGKVDSPDALCPEASRTNSRPFKVGEKVYLAQIDVDLKKEKISFRILACDSCNGPNPVTTSKSEVVFQFAPGDLEKASVLDVEDTIGEVLAIDSSGALQAPQSTPPQSEDLDPNTLTNDKVIRMASAKLGDAVILGKIKTSQCSFDTSTDALIKLKNAGVSDAVLQTMIETGAQSNRSDSGEAPLDSAQPTTLSGLYVSLFSQAQLQFNRDGSFSQHGPGSWENSGHFTVNGDTLSLMYPSTGRSSIFSIRGDTIYNESGKAVWARQGDLPAPAPAAEANCASYDACMKEGGVSLDLSKGNEALAGFQKASHLDPSKGEAWAGMGDAYLQMGHYDDAARMWDKALELGATLTSHVCHAGMACGDTGDFLLSMKEVSFVNKKKGEKEFAAAPSAVISEVGFPRVWGGNGQIVAYYVQLRSSGKNYRFYYGPKSVQCRDNLFCPEPGLTQQKVFADYVHSTLDKLRNGSFGSTPSKP